MKRRYRVIVGTPLRQFTVDAENETEARDEGHRLFDAEIDENEGHPLYDSSNEIYITAQEIWICERCKEDFGRPKYMTIRTQEDGKLRFLCFVCAEEEDKAS